MKSKMLQAAVMIIAAFAFFTACSTPPPVINTPLPTGTAETNTPIPMPRTRTAPTLPPTFTPTVTPTITNTPTVTPTPTATSTLTIDQTCEQIGLPWQELEGMTINSRRGKLLLFGGGLKDGTINLVETNLDTGQVLRSELPTGVSFGMQYGVNHEAGNYELVSTVTIAGYVDICQQTVRYTIVAPTPTPTAPESSLIGDLLEVILRHAQRGSTTPEVTPES